MTDRRNRTAQICREKGYNLLDLPVNLGLAGGFQAGLKYAWRNGYEYAVQFDGDGQHRPEFIQTMKEKMAEGYDIVIGSRFVTEKKPKTMRMLGSNLISGAIRLDHRRKSEGSHIRYADVPPENDRGVCAQPELRAGAGYGVLSAAPGRKGGRGAGKDG